MAQWYESLTRQMALAAATAWTDVEEVIRPEQLGRRNFQRDIEDAQLHPPFAVLRVGTAVSATEYAGDGIPLRVAVTIWRVEDWQGAGGDQTTDVFGQCATLLSWLHNNYLPDMVVEMHRGVAIDASTSTLGELQRILHAGLPFAVASLTVSVITGSRN